MSRAKFSVTYSIVTEVSAAQGCDAESGFIDDCLSLRDAITLTHKTRTAHVGGVESITANDSMPLARVRWVTVSNSMEFLTGEYEQRSLHIPETVSRFSAWRIAKLLGVQL